jgi:hypothetical protein
MEMEMATATAGVGGSMDVELATVSALHAQTSSHTHPLNGGHSANGHSNGSNRSKSTDDTNFTTVDIGRSNSDEALSGPKEGAAVVDPSVVPVRDLKFWVTFVLFMFMGSGANWVFATALAQEIPYFENHMSEGDCVATYMNAATNASFIAVVIYLVIYSYYQIPHKYSVPILLFFSAFGSFLTAATSSKEINGVPVALLICCAIGGIVGGLAGVIMQPFLTYFKTDFISGARAGGSGCMILTALVAIAQDPGTSSQHFSVAVYFTIFGIILSLSLAAYFYIVHMKLGLKDPNVTPLNSSSATAGKAATSNRGSDMSIDSIYTSSNKGKYDGHVSTGQDSEQVMFASSRRYANKIADGFMDTCIPSGLFKTFPWLRVTLPYLMTVAWIDFNTWGMLSAVGPFAMFNTSYGGGALNLAIAYELGSFSLFFGDFSTIYFRLPFFYSLIIFTSFAFTLYVYASFNTIGFDRSTAPILIAIWTIGRYLEAHMLTSCYRAVAVEVPFEHRESAARAVGLFDQIFTTVGAILSTTLVSTLVKC